MMNSLKSLIVGAIAVLALSSTANASLIIWDFTGGGTNTHEKTVTSSGVDITVAGWSNDDTFATAGTAETIRHNSAGLGVEGCGGTQVGNNCDSFYAEWISVLAPAEGWSNVVIGLGAINSLEEWFVFGSTTADLDPTGSLLFLAGGVGGGLNIDLFAIPGASDWAYLIIGVTTNDDLSGWRVASIQATVPEPTALLLVAIGLLGLASVGAMTRRKKAA